MSGLRARPVGRGPGFWGGQATKTTVVSSSRITPSTHDIILAKPDGFDFLPVQFTFLTLITDLGPDTRPMSLATSPTRPNLEYGVRISDSPYKRAFASLKPGDTVQIQGPYGDFVIDEKRPALLVAGGIGITPLKGMVEYAADKKLEIPIRLLYSNRTEDDIAYRAPLEELERQNPRFRVLHMLTSELSPKDWAGLRGRIRPELLRKATEDLSRPVYYLCGKPSMVSAVYGMLGEMGVPEDDVRIEVFRGYWS
jgi:glycine betaine catabolism B